MSKGTKHSNVHVQILQETNQTPETRTFLFEDIEKILGRPIVTFFTSFRYNVSIDDADADMLQSVLSQLDLRTCRLIQWQSS